jgi:hypothetical protein
MGSAHSLIGDISDHAFAEVNFALPILDEAVNHERSRS